MEGDFSKIVLTGVVVVAIAAIAMAVILTAGSPQDSLPDDTRLLLSVDEVGLINQELARDGSVSIPMNAKSAPEGCPQSGKACIWICTGDGPLDSLDDECSTDVWVCRNCDGNPNVCKTGEGKDIPCPEE